MITAAGRMPGIAQGICRGEMCLGAQHEECMRFMLMCVCAPRGGVDRGGSAWDHWEHPLWESHGSKVDHVEAELVWGFVVVHLRVCLDWV